MNHRIPPLSRRRFLGTLGAVTAAPMFVSPAILGRAGTVAPNSRIVMANFGHGNRAGAIIGHFMQFPELHMKVICDCREDRLKNGVDRVNAFYRNQDCERLTDFRELLARPDIDAVFIATGNRWHGLGSILAAKAGKDIYCEKPTTLTIAEGRELVETTTRHGTVYQAGHQRRSVDSYRFMKEVVRRGMIGRVREVIMQSWEGPVIQAGPNQEVPAGFNYDMWLGQTPWRPFNWAHVNAWQYFWDTADGIITDMGCHYTDLMQFTFETDDTGPVAFEGWAEWPPEGAYSETPVRAQVRCQYANGVTGVIQQRAGFTDRFIRFVGDEGWIQVDDETNVVTAAPASILKTRSIVNKSWAETGGHIQDWITAIRNRGKPACHPETTHRAMSICQISNLCLRLGRKLHWDPVVERFTDDEEANRMLARSRRSPWHA
ncbi:MAG: Gfo/Idh/MocA family oxidoreductase [Verrucomicrobiales bacterium]|nr:Gfo/Idh/MocA family oxidoreductase [Verrucomicrobiales bacterium]